MVYLYVIMRGNSRSVLLTDGVRSVYTYAAVNADAMELWALYYIDPPAGVLIVPGIWDYTTARTDADRRFTEGNTRGGA